MESQISTLKSKFRGCLLGVLIGDCLGVPFEGDTMNAEKKVILQEYFDNLEDDNFQGSLKQYSDDTAMTKSIAKSLVDKPEVNFAFMAKLFVKEYYLEPDRGYGPSIAIVFDKLRKNEFQDIYKPATEQFSGSGSFGNGGAMRISPIPLYFNDNYKLMIDVATKATKITHTNELGIHGALLQCMAIQQALEIQPTEKINTFNFVEKLLQKIKPIEDRDYELHLDGLDDALTPYQEKLNYIKNLLERRYDEGELDDEVIENLGNSLSALESVATAIYCFLKSYKENAEIKTLFRRTIQYAIGLGGDTDTIGSMAGAIAGAFLGEEYISPNLIRHCESHKEMIELADNLLSARTSANSS